MKGEGREFLELLEEVADAEDLPALMAACAGRRLYVPNTEPSDNSWIVVAIGREKADALVKRLDEAGWYGSEIDIPFNGGGMIRAFHRAIRQRIAESVRAGKSNGVIAAEVGITRRAVVLNKAKLRELGELPEVDPVAALKTRYRGKTASNTSAPATPDATLWGSASTVPEDVEAEDEPSIAELPEGPSDDARVRDRIIALIGHECGEADAAQILALAGTRAWSIGPRAVRSPKHPFSVILGADSAVALAVKVVAVFGVEMIRLKDRVTDLDPVRRCIRAKLHDRILPQRIAQDLSVPIALVHSELSKMRKAGLLPPARSKRKLRGY